MLNHIRPDVWLGGVIAALGVWAAFEAFGFGEKCWAYPFALSVALGVAGMMVGLRVVTKPRRDKSRITSLLTIAQGPLAIAIVLAIWAVALDVGLGYLGPTVVASVAILLVVGVRGWAKLCFYALAVTAAVFGLFGLIFATRLPVLEPVGSLIS